MSEPTQDPQEQQQDGPQTVTQFAVQEGNLDADAPGVQDTIDAEKRRAEEGTERAQRVSDLMSGDQDAQDAAAQEADEG